MNISAKQAVYSESPQAGQMLQSGKGIVDRFCASHWAVYLFFLLIAFLVYWPTQSARFVQDTVMWAYRYDTMSMAEFLQLLSIKGFLPTKHLVLFSLYKVFGFNPTVWFLVFVTLHSLLAVNVKRLTEYALGQKLTENKERWAFIAGFMFLLSPYQTEVVVWGSTIHYIMVGLFITSWLLLVFRNKGSISGQLAVVLNVIFFVAIFALELGIMILPIAFLLFWWGKNFFGADFNGKRFAYSVLVPMIGLVGLYFLINKMTIGVYIGHYGGDPLEQTTLHDIGSNYLRYGSWFGGYASFYSFHFREKVVNILGKPVFGYAAFFIALAAGIFSLWYYRFKTSNISWALFYFLLFSLLLLPILPLYFYNVSSIENTRYAYVPSCFFFPFLILFCQYLKPLLRYIILGVYFIIGAYFLIGAIHAWSTAGKLFTGLVDDFRWFYAEHVYVLTLPDSYSDAPVFREYDQENPLFYQTLSVFYHRPLPVIHEVLQYNTISDHDSLPVSFVNDSTIGIGFGPPGTWFWYNAKGAVSYEKDDYAVTVFEYSAEVILKKQYPNSVFIYSVGDKWKELKRPTEWPDSTTR